MSALLSQWTQFFSTFFVNPALVVPGLALVASPLIIHLINRMRFRRVRFAAMEFLLQSQRRNRRRILIEQLLLLLLRVLIVLALMLLIARLVLNEDQFSILTGDKSYHIVLIDDSGSMQDRGTDGSAFDQALDVVRKLAAEGSRRPNTQKMTIVLLSDLEKPLKQYVDVNAELLTDLEADFENLQCSHQTLDLSDGLEAAGRLFAAEPASMKHLHVVSDFRDRDWTDHTALSKSIRRLDDTDVAVNLVRTVAEQHANLGITELSGNVHVAAAGVPLRLKVAVKNYSQQIVENVRVSIVVDNQKLPISLLFDKIEPGVTVSREKDLAFTAGPHEVKMELPSDSLAGDNARYMAFTIAPSHPVLIIDGDSSGDAGLYVSDALAADPSLTGFNPIIERPDYLARHPLQQFQCIYLINVPELRPDQLGPLVEYAEQGGGLAWFVGPAVNATYYNDVLYGTAKGLFPVPLARTSGELEHGDQTLPGPDLVFTSHPIFRIFEGQDNPLVETVRIDRYLPVRSDWDQDDNRRKDGVATIASLRNKQPLVFEHRYGKQGGRIVTCLTTAGPLWNNWARNPTYVIAQLELEKHIARNDRTLDNRRVGEPIRLKLDPAEFLPRVDIASPNRDPETIQASRSVPPQNTTDGKDQQKSGNPAQARASASELVLNYRETDRPGVYRVQLYDQDQQPVESSIAYNVPVEESDLGLIASAQIRKLVGEDVELQIQEPGAVDWIEGKDAGQEVRQFLIYLLIGFFIIEQLLAYRLSFHPKTVGATV